MKKETTDFLNDHRWIHESVLLGISKHLSDSVAEQFLSIAKEYDADAHFQIQQCQECIDELVKFVYMKYDGQKVKVSKNGKI